MLSSTRLRQYRDVDIVHGEPHSHESAQLIAVLSGAIEVVQYSESGQRVSTQLLRENSWTIIPAGTPHTGRTTEPNSEFLFMESSGE